jgi:phospholipase C
VTATNAYDGRGESRHLKPGQSLHTGWSLESSHGWYDLVVQADTDSHFLRRLAGHLENGKPSASDPALGARPV